jgi:hypothetical protein
MIIITSRLSSWVTQKIDHNFLNERNRKAGNTKGEALTDCFLIMKNQYSK